MFRYTARHRGPGGGETAPVTSPIPLTSIRLHVADLALGLLISVMRRICECDRFARAGRWLAGYPPVGSGLSGKTCGIVGLGRIGRAIAKRAEAFDMLVRYHGPHRKQDVAYEDRSDLESMARESDCLIVACRATPETRNLIDARILEALGPGGIPHQCRAGLDRGRSCVDRCAESWKDSGRGAGCFRG